MMITEDMPIYLVHASKLIQVNIYYLCQNIGCLPPRSCSMIVRFRNHLNTTNSIDMTQTFHERQ